MRSDALNSRAVVWMAGASVAAWLVLSATSPHAASPAQGSAGETASRASGIAGRWTLQYEVQAASGQRGVGGGRRGGGAGLNGAPAAEGGGRAGTATPARGGGGGAGRGGSGVARVVLDLRPGPANTLTGTAMALGAGNLGGGGGAGSQPVEISSGQFDGSRVSFEVWALDNYRNRTRYEGRLEGNTLALALSRQTPGGVETIAQVTATRLPY